VIANRPAAAGHQDQSGTAATILPVTLFSDDVEARLLERFRRGCLYKPKLAAFEEVPFTTDSAEYDVLRSPSSSTKVDYDRHQAEPRTQAVQ
jgi:hypothetical protein